jgi:hypothetical protein
MKRREIIKNLVLSSGLFFIPGSFIKLKVERLIYLINIDSFWYQSLEDFCSCNPRIKCISIDWDTESSNDVLQSILSFLKPDRRYLFVCDLTERNTILSTNLIRGLQKESIEFRFFGTTPIFNNRLGKWAKTTLSEFENDPRVQIFDVNDYLGHLNRIQPGVMASDAFGELEFEIYSQLCTLFFLAQNPIPAK